MNWEAQALAMRRLSAPGFTDGLDDCAYYEKTRDGLVLGCIPEGHRQAGVPALVPQCQLALRPCEMAWMMFQKVRWAMVNVAREPLQGEVEADDTWVGSPQAGFLRGTVVKRLPRNPQ
jgi:hypothetical protein